MKTLVEGNAENAENTDISAKGITTEASKTKGDMFYEYCDKIGAGIVDVIKYIVSYLLLIEGFIFKVASKLKDILLRNLKVFLVRNGFELDEVKEWYDFYKDGNDLAASKGFWAWVGYWNKSVKRWMAKGLKALISTPNYYLPLASAMAFAIIVYATINMNFAIKVVYDGEDVGFIDNETVYNDAMNQMLGRVMFDESSVASEDELLLTAKFKIGIASKDEIITENKLTDELIRASGSQLTQAYGLYVEEDFVGAVINGEQIVDVLDGIKEPYETGDPTEEIGFTKAVEIRDGLYPTQAVTEIGEIETAISREVEDERIYTAVAGDAPLLIAAKNDVPYNELIALNPEIEKSLLIGQEVLVAKSVPFLGVEVTREIEYTEETSFKIQQVQDKDKPQGYVMTTQQGEKGEVLYVASVTYVDGVETDRDIISETVTKDPVDEIVVVGGQMPAQYASGGAVSTSFRWPVDGGRVSAGLYGYPGHTGMDIAAPTGTAVRAAAAGVVSMVKYSYTGYGFHLMIDHGGGMQTLYGHNSKIHVVTGQWVEQGELIASIGSTGRSTGPHVHFEVRQNGRYMDPAKYVGWYYPF